MIFFFSDKNVNWIVDVGSGLGYLSSALAVDFKLNVMALDASKLNIDGLAKFAQRYEVWCICTCM